MKQIDRAAKENTEVFVDKWVNYVKYVSQHPEILTKTHYK